MNFTTYTLSEKPQIIRGFFDCLAPAPLTITQSQSLNVVCQPGGINWVFHPEQVTLGLLSDNNYVLTFPFCGRFRVWVSLVFDAIFQCVPNAATTPPVDITQVKFGTLPVIKFWLQNNNYVAEYIRATPNFLNANTFPDNCVVTEETVQAGITSMAQNTNYTNVAPLAIAPATLVNPLFNPMQTMMTFYDDPQDTFLTYANTAFPWYNDGANASQQYLRQKNVKVCIWSFLESNNTATLVTKCLAHEFDGVFNQMVIDRKAIARWFGGTYGTVNVVDPCGNPHGLFPSYQNNITLNPHFGVLGFRVEMYPLIL